MRRLNHAIRQISLLGLGLGLIISLQAVSPIVRYLKRSPLPPPVLTFTPTLITAFAPPRPLRYEQRSQAQSTIHLLFIPANSRFSVTVALAPTLESLETLAQQTEAIAALNGGFFDPENQQSTSFIRLQDTLVADPRQNERLTQNPELRPYLDAIFNRSELRQYNCAETRQYEIARHQAPHRPGCQLVAALGAGPQLLPTLTLQPEGFWDEQNGSVIRDSLGSNQPNARSAVGITASGDLILVMVAEQPNRSGSSGMSLNQLAQLMRSLGAVTAMNLDGGSSTAFYYNGQTVYGKAAADGTAMARPIKSALIVQPIP